MRTRATQKRPSRLSELLLLGWAFGSAGCSLLTFGDNLTFDREPGLPGDDGGVVPDRDGALAADAREPLPSEEDASVPLPDAGEPEDSAASDAGAPGSDADATLPPVPPPPVPPPPVSPCAGATAHRVVMATPVELLGGTCTSIPGSASVQDDSSIRLVSWTIDFETCEFTRVREANYGSSGWTNTETGRYTSSRDSEGFQEHTEWGPTPCTRQMRWRWTDLED